MQIDPLYQVNEFRKIRGVTALHIAAELNVSKSTYYRRLRLGGGAFEDLWSAFLAAEKKASATPLTTEQAAALRRSIKGSK